MNSIEDLKNLLTAAMDSVTTLIYSVTWLTGVAVTYAIFCLYVACLRWRFRPIYPRFVHHAGKHITNIVVIISIIKTIIARGSSLDRDLEGFPLNQEEVDQRGQDECVVDGDVEDGLHDA